MIAGHCCGGLYSALRARNGIHLSGNSPTKFKHDDLTISDNCIVALDASLRRVYVILGLRLESLERTERLTFN